MKVVHESQVLEQWRSVGHPGMYEIVMETPADEVPVLGEVLEFPDIGSCNIATLFIGRASSPEFVRLRLEVHQEVTPT